jgi:hypothetical protein
MTEDKLRTELEPLMARLEDEEMRLMGRSIDQGCVDSGLAANVARETAQAIEGLLLRIESLTEALTPSGDTKAAYHGEFHFPLARLDECGDEYSERVCVPWDSVKQIMAAIKTRAGVSQ